MMKNIFLILLIFFAFNTFPKSEDLAFVTGDPYTNYFSVNLDVEILSTISSKTHPKVILKNNLTGAVKTYSIGDKFIYDNNSFKVLHISDCLVSLISG